MATERIEMEELSSQTVGLIAGVIVFMSTVVVTFLLLVFGGSFKRMREQASRYMSTWCYHTINTTLLYSDCVVC